MLSIFRWIRIVPRRDGILTADFTVAALDDEFTAPAAFERLAGSLICVALRTVDASGAVGVQALVHPFAVMALENDSIATFTHMSSLLEV
jgi:hypothetical protein